MEIYQIHYVDVGTSGGVAGLDRGYCLMIGGEADFADKVLSAMRHGFGGHIEKLLTPPDPVSQATNPNTSQVQKTINKQQEY